MKLRLLLLSGASLVGQNILESLCAVRSDIHLIAMNSVAQEPALFEFDEVFLSKRLGEDLASFTRLFENVLACSKPNLVIPCRDEDVLFLAGMKESSSAYSPRFLCGSVSAAAAMLDKKLSWEFSQRHDLPFADTISAELDAGLIKGFAEKHGFPLIAKPRRGFASRGVFLILDQRQLAEVAGATGYILQEYIGDTMKIADYAKNITLGGIPLFHTLEAAKISIQSFIAPDGRVAGMVVTRNTMQQGCSDRVSLESAPDATQLGELCATVFSAQGWRGPLNIQCQRAVSGNLRIYEYNGRFTGATAARYLLGYDEVGLAIEAFCSSMLNRVQAVSDCASQEVVRLSRSQAINPGNVNKLLRSGYWRKS